MKQMIIILCFFWMASAYSEDKQQYDQPLPLATTNAAASSIVRHCVNAITGQYFDSVVDLILPGAETLKLERTYFNQTSHIGTFKYGWRHNHESYATIWKGPYKDYLARYTETNGSTTYYKESNKEGNLAKLGFHLEVNKRGLTNCSTHCLSGKENLKNHRLHFDSGRKKATVYSGDGAERYFSKHPISKYENSYLLDNEKKPQGSNVCYKYDSEGKLTNVKAKDSNSGIVFSHLTFIPSDNFDQSLRLTAKASDGRQVIYKFIKMVPSKEEAKLNRDVRYYIGEVESPEQPKVSYEYRCDPGWRDLLIKKVLPNKRYLAIDYYHPGTNHVGKDIVKDPPIPMLGRVKVLQAPVGTNNDPVVTHRFFYHLHTDQYGFLTKESSTDVYGALNHKISYVFSKEERLIAIKKFRGLDNKVLYTTERFFWGDEDSKDCTHLMTHSLHNGEGHPIYFRHYKYDERGNVLNDKFYGNLSGANKKNPTLSPQGVPVDNGCECYTVSYTYFQDGFNNVRTQEEGNKKILFRYKPSTNLVTSKLTLVDKAIVLREFYEYNEQGVEICKICDDGENRELNDLTGIRERHIIRTIPTTEFPIGLPEIVEEYYLDLTTGKECLLKKHVNTYLNGRIIQEDTYDREGNFAYSKEWDYNNYGQIIKEKDPLGHEIIRKYDINGNLEYEQGPRPGHFKNFTHDYSNRLVRSEEVLPDGQKLVNTYRYDHLSNKTATTDIYGYETRFKYDAFGRLIKTIMPPCTDEQGNQIKPSVINRYDEQNNLIMKIDARGFATASTYNARGQPTRVEYPDGSVEKNLYNLNGTLRKATAKNGTYTLYTYDYQKRPTKKRIFSPTGQLLAVTISIYNAFHLIKEIDAEGFETHYTYDDAGHLTDVKKDGSHTSYHYDLLDRLTETREWFGFGEKDFVKKIKVLDFLDRVQEEREEDADEVVLKKVNYSYDECGNRKEVTTFNDSGTGTTKTVYDARNQPSLIVDALGFETHIVHRYDFLNERGEGVPYKEETDPLGNMTISIGDALGRVTKEIRKNPLGIITQQSDFLYDASGNRCKIVETVKAPDREDKEIITLIAYDKLNRVSAFTEAVGTPEQKHTEWTYHHAGQKKTIVKSDGVVIHHDYDALDRLETYSASDDSFKYTYTYDRNNNLKTITDGVNITTRDYDAHNRLILETLANGLTLTYKYDRIGRPILVTLPDESSIAYTYDATYVRRVARLSSENRELYHHDYLNYDLSGNFTKANLIGKAGTLSQEYDLANRTSKITAFGWNEQVFYDPVGNLEIRNQQDSQGSVECLYKYDDLYQLQAENGIAEHRYVHDSLYNCVNKDDQPRFLNALHQLKNDGSTSYEYDDNGNLKLKTSTHTIQSYEYDALDRLVKISDSSQQVSYQYDAKNRRISKTFCTASGDKLRKVNYLYIDQNEIGCCDEQGNIIELRLLGATKKAEIGAAIAIELSTIPYAPIHDHNGNVVSLLTQEGQEFETYRFSAFGEEQNSGSVNPWRFSSKRYDEETGFIYFGRRYYDPATSRWVTPDPLGREGGPNLYAYVRNNPLTHFDLYGLKEYSPQDFIDSMRADHLASSARIAHQQEMMSRALISPMFNYNSYETGIVGKFNLPDKKIFFMNGINNTRSFAIDTASLLSEYAGGHQVKLIHNKTFGPVLDILRWHTEFKHRYISTACRELLRETDRYFSTASEHATLLLIVHSESATVVKNYLRHYNLPYRDRIEIIAVSPSAYITEDLSRSVHHLRSEGDYVTLFDIGGRNKCKATTQTLKPHIDTFEDKHSIRSTTYADYLKRYITNYLNRNQVRS